MCVSWMRDGTVTPCNSLLNTKTKKCMTSKSNSMDNKQKSVQFLPVQQQKGSVDCGCFAIDLQCLLLRREPGTSHLQPDEDARAPCDVL